MELNTMYACVSLWNWNGCILFARLKNLIKCTNIWIIYESVGYFSVCVCGEYNLSYVMIHTIWYKSTFCILELIVQQYRIWPNFSVSLPLTNIKLQGGENDFMKDVELPTANWKRWDRISWCGKIFETSMTEYNQRFTTERIHYPTKGVAKTIPMWFSISQKLSIILEL